MWLELHGCRGGYSQGWRGSLVKLTCVSPRVTNFLSISVSYTVKRGLLN